MQRQMLAEFAFGFRAVCEGQALDKEFETRPEISTDEYLHMIDLKTAKIFELAAVMGSLAVGGEFVEDIRRFAHHLGLAFQINDDLLDLVSDEATFGKTPGGDIIEGKRTFLFAAACERYHSLRNDQQTLIERIRDRKTTQADIVIAREVMEATGILALARQRSEQETNEAMKALSNLPYPDELREYAQLLLLRDR
jgi:geranylgeranyl diphosphate synthase type II